MVRRPSWVAAVVTVVLVFVSSFALPYSSARADLIVGTPNEGNLFPFSAGYINEYQQVFKASAFPGIQAITALSFATISGPRLPESLTFTLSLSTTLAGPSTLSTNYAANRGDDFIQVFSGTVTYTPKTTVTTDLTIFTSLFTYDPSKGNLLMDLNISSGAGGGTQDIANFFAADLSGNSLGRVYQSPGDPLAVHTDATGLVTEFGSTVQPFVTPEPSSVALLAIGAVGAGLVRWKRWRGRGPASQGKGGHQY
jgi:hypothetical protein